MNEEIKKYFTDLKTLPDGRIAGLSRFLFTTGLVVDIQEDCTFKYRYCFENENEAREALNSWNGEGDPPLNWIKEKGIRGERSNPSLSQFKGIDVKTEQLTKPRKNKI